jgi:hypothetical protein
MAKRRRRTSKRTARGSADSRGWLPRYPALWLATLSTVVGVATGMFTLRDQLFPRESGTAAAVSVPAYQQGVGRVCDEVNRNDDDRAREDRESKVRLRVSKTTVGQRNVLVDAARRTASRTAHALASFSGLETPGRLAAVSRTTRAAWEHYLARLREYARALDRVGTRGSLVRALERLADTQPAFGRDSDTVRSGLASLGGENCDLEPRIITHTYTLPPPTRERRTADQKHPPANQPPTTNSGPAPGPIPTTSPSAPRVEPPANAPPANVPPQSTPPPPSRSPGAGSEPANPPVGEG